jgi:SAM-dependent methyltransferase
MSFGSMTSPTSPGIFDYIDLFALRLVKSARPLRTDDGSFYEAFFTDDDVEKYRLDVRNAFRFWRVEDSYRELFGDGAARIADIGAGLGMAAGRLPAAADYIGVEYADATLALARRENQRSGAEFRKGGFPDLPVATGWADFAVCLEVIEHVPDDALAVADLFRIVRPGGHLLISAPGGWYWPDYQGLIGHYRHYSRAALDSLLADAGFETVRGFPQHRAFWRFYHYLYLWLKAFELAVRKTVSQDFSVLRSRPVRALAARIEARLRGRPPIDDAGSTFLLCRKPEAALP